MKRNEILVAIGCTWLCVLLVRAPNKGFQVLGWLGIGFAGLIFAAMGAEWILDRLDERDAAKSEERPERVHPHTPGPHTICALCGHFIEPSEHFPNLWRTTPTWDNAPITLGHTPWPTGISDDEAREIQVGAAEYVENLRFDPWPDGLEDGQEDSAFEETVFLMEEQFRVRINRQKSEA